MIKPTHTPPNTAGLSDVSVLYLTIKMVIPRAPDLMLC